MLEEKHGRSGGRFAGSEDEMYLHLLQELVPAAEQAKEVRAGPRQDTPQTTFRTSFNTSQEIPSVLPCSHRLPSS